MLDVPYNWCKLYGSAISVLWMYPPPFFPLLYTLLFIRICFIPWHSPLSATPVPGPSPYQATGAAGPISSSASVEAVGRHICLCHVRIERHLSVHRILFEFSVQISLRVSPCLDVVRISLLSVDRVEIGWKIFKFLFLISAIYQVR